MVRIQIPPDTVQSPGYFVVNSILALVLCLAGPICVLAQDQQKSSSAESWTTTKEAAIPNTNPSRATESHVKSGNRTVDAQKLEVLGPNGEYVPSAETETETIQVNGTTTRTTVRTYRWDANGRKILAQVAEEESRATAGGDVHTERKTSSADVNGNFQVVRREVAETKKISPDVEETKSTIYQRDSYGGLTQAEQTQELKTHGADDSVAVKQTTLLPDGNGGWKVGGVTEKTIKTDGQNRTTEERSSRPDLDGRLHENSRKVSREAETPTGAKRTTVETYDGNSQMTQRITKVQRKDATGEETEQQVEQPNYGNPSDGMKVSGRAKYVVKYAGPGTQQTNVGEIRDANGNFHVAAVETQRSTQPPPSQTKPAAKADSDKAAPPPKP